MSDFNFVKKFLLKMKKIGKNYDYNLNDIFNFYKNSFKKNSRKTKFNYTLKYSTELDLTKYYEI